MLEIADCDLLVDVVSTANTLSTVQAPSCPKVRELAEATRFRSSGCLDDFKSVLCLVHTAYGLTPYCLLAFPLYAHKRRV